jgi:hypothetical protein
MSALKQKLVRISTLRFTEHYETPEERRPRFAASETRGAGGGAGDLKLRNRRQRIETALHSFLNLIYDPKGIDETTEF